MSISSDITRASHAALSSLIDADMTLRSGTATDAPANTGGVSGASSSTGATNGASNAVKSSNLSPTSTSSQAGAAG